MANLLEPWLLDPLLMYRYSLSPDGGVLVRERGGGGGGGRQRVAIVSSAPDSGASSEHPVSPFHDHHPVV